MWDPRPSAGGPEHGLGEESTPSPGREPGETRSGEGEQSPTAPGPPEGPAAHPVLREDVVQSPGVCLHLMLQALPPPGLQHLEVGGQGNDILTKDHHVQTSHGSLLPQKNKEMERPGGKLSEDLVSWMGLAGWRAAKQIPLAQARQGPVPTTIRMETLTGFLASQCPPPHKLASYLVRGSGVHGGAALQALPRELQSSNQTLVLLPEVVPQQTLRTGGSDVTEARGARLARLSPTPAYSLQPHRPCLSSLGARSRTRRDHTEGASGASTVHPPPANSRERPRFLVQPLT